MATIAADCSAWRVREAVTAVKIMNVLEKYAKGQPTRTMKSIQRSLLCYRVTIHVTGKARPGEKRSTKLQNVIKLCCVRKIRKFKTQASAISRCEAWDNLITLATTARDVMA